MISVNQAIELTNNYNIQFPANWKDQMLSSVETGVETAARKGKRNCTIKGSVTPHSPAGGYGYGQLFLNTDQFSEIVAEVRMAGFKVEEDFKIRWDGQPMTIDIYWGM